MRRPLRRIRRSISGILLVLLLWGTVHTVFILIDGFSDELPEQAIAVVFGNQVHPDGRVSDRLAARLDKTIELYAQGRVRIIFASGGLGVEGHPEGTVMRNYLVAAGIPEDIVVVDDAGNSTQETAENFRRIFGAGISEIVVVTQYYHISRARLAMHKAGYSLVNGVHADLAWEWRDIYSVFREFPGYYAYLFRTFELP